MESINNTLKGYGKITDHENQTHPRIPNSSPRKTLIAIASVVSLLAVIAVVAVAAGAISRPPNRLSDSSESLKTICAVTRYPDSCFGSLSSALKQPDPNTIRRVDPESIFKLSIRVSAKEISSLAMTFRSINDLPEDAAVGDCVKLFGDALSQLNESVSAAEKKSGEWLTEAVIGDIKTWISAAMTDVETCSDGLEEMGSTVGDRIKKQMETAKEMMSNSLAIVSQMKKLLEKFH